ncbi:MAG: T9SS type A sorting domain-containing protein, partial [Bacteroidota bacterium]
SSSEAIITGDLDFQSATVLDIGNNQLTFNETGAVVPAAFDATRMIRVNSASPLGVEKQFNTILTNFLFPVGTIDVSASNNKYTPVTILSIQAPASGSKEILVRPVDGEYPTNLCDNTPSNVLTHFWDIETDDVSGLNGSIQFQYTDADVAGDETQFQNARLRAGSAAWDRIALNGTPGYPAPNVNGINAGTNTIVWEADQFTAGGGGNDFAGSYSAGEQTDLLDRRFYRIRPGADQTICLPWDGSMIWEASSDPTFPAVPVTATVEIMTPPCDGAVAFVQEEFTVCVTPTNNIILDGFIIEGTIDLGATEQHDFGGIEGNGTMIDAGADGQLPAGDFLTTPAFGNGDLFLSDTDGGTVVYEATGNVMNVLADTRFDDVAGSTLYNLTLTGNGTINFGFENLVINNDMLVQSDGGTLDVNMDDATIELAGDLTKDDDSNFQYIGEGGDEAPPFDYDPTVSGVNEGVLILNGDGPQTITGNFTGSSALHNLQINNSAGATIVGDVELTNTLFLTDGIITIPNSGDAITLVGSNAGVFGANYTPALGSLSAGGSVNSFVDGVFAIANLTDGEVFFAPIGDVTPQGTVYAPAGVNADAGNGGPFTFSYTYTNPQEYTPEGGMSPFDVEQLGAGNPNQLENASQEEWWQVTGTGSAQVILSWGTHSSVTDPSTLVTAQWDDFNNSATDTDQWENTGSGGFSGSANSGVISTGVSINFGTTSLNTAAVTLAGLLPAEPTPGTGNGGLNNPLPVEFLDFTGELIEEGVDLDWSTATESENDYFDVERSADGFDYQAIGRVDGAGTTNEIQYYTFLDPNPLWGTSYYRLRQVDTDGTASFSKVIVIHNDREGSQVLVAYPNPFGTSFSLRWQGYGGAMQINIYDLQGRTIFASEVMESDVNGTWQFEKGEQLSVGMYLIQVKIGEEVQSFKLVKEE